MKLLYLHDADPACLAARVASIRDERRGGAMDGWEVRATPSRNALLASIEEDAGSGRHSVALIDLRAETGDLEQVGFRIVETIRRHPILARVCRPVVCTDEMTAANAGYADAIGAFAIIDTTWTQSQAGAPLSDLFEWALGERAGEFRLHRTHARVVPGEGANKDEEEHERAAQFRAWFGFAPSELHLALLWGMANAVELEFLKESLAEEGVATSPGAAKKQLERLQQAMAIEVEAMDRPETARAEIARRFLAEAIPPQPDPFPGLNWPMLSHVRKIWRTDRETVHHAFLESGGTAVLDRFFDALDLPPGGARVRHPAIRSAIELTAKRRDLPVADARSMAHRALHALDDAWADRRLHGEAQQLPLLTF